MDEKYTVDDKNDFPLPKSAANNEQEYATSTVSDTGDDLVASSPSESKASGSQTTSSGTNGTLSSADTAPALTQEINDTSELENLEKRPAWGLLCSMQSQFYTLDLVNNDYTFGRSDQCDYNLDIPSIKKTKYFRNYSKSHFAISRVMIDDNTSFSASDMASTFGSNVATSIQKQPYRVHIEDLGGTNGTFINGDKIPSSRRRLIKTNDKIALAYSHNEIFIFVDYSTASDKGHPEEFSKKYVLNESLGKGAMGEVFEVWLKVGVGRFAVKIIDKKSTSLYSTSCTVPETDVLKEAKILQQLEHPCIIGMYDVFDSPSRLYIVLEYAAGGELFERVSKGGKLPESLAKLYFYQMLMAVKYLHMNGITHRDLKPENILLMSREEPSLLKLTDFGLSRLVGETSLMKTLAGTQSYLAPEIAALRSGNTRTGYTKLVDMWSLGVILYVCLVAYPPFNESRTDTKQSLQQQILNCNLVFFSPSWNTISKQAKDLLRSLLKIDTKQRFDSSQALDHEWLNDPDMKRIAAQLMATSNESNVSLNPLITKSLSDVSKSTRKVSTDDDKSEGHGNTNLVTVQSRSGDPLLKAYKRHAESIDSFQEHGDSGDTEHVLPKQSKFL